MFMQGERIKIRDESGRRWWGRVTETRTYTESIDVTRDPAKGGPGYRESMPGFTSLTLTVEIEGPRD